MISFSSQLRRLADAAPDRPAVTCGDESVTRSELVVAADELAVALAERGVGFGDMVTIALPNSVEWFVTCAAVWRLGAIPQPVSARLPARELQAIVELADPSVVVGAAAGSLGSRMCIPAGYRAPRGDASVLPDVVSPAWKAPTSGGSTGRPKLIVTTEPAALDPSEPPPLLLGTDGCLVMPGPTYHNGPLVWTCRALLGGNHVVLLPRFDAEATLAAIERHRAGVVYLVPTMMKRIWRLPDDIRTAYDLSSLRVLWHLAEPCPPWLKGAFIDWLGPERVFELYAGTEAQAVTVITGPEWLAHRGSVGRPEPGTVEITDERGESLGPGEAGEVWLRPVDGRSTYSYVGAEARRRPGGWESLGDLGHLDEAGYLFLADRSADMILTGGANVYPAEVEAAIGEHHLVRSCAVIGLPDADRGNVIHAIVEADPDTFDREQLMDFLAERLVSYKLPRTIELVDAPLRDDAGKVRRSALRRERLGDAPAGEAPTCP